MAHPSDLCNQGMSAVLAELLGFTYETLTSSTTGVITISKAIIRASAQAAVSNFIMLPAIDMSKTKLHILTNISAANTLYVRTTGSESIVGADIDGKTISIAPQTSALFIRESELLNEGAPAWGCIRLGTY